jgi:hypothetical protein
MGSNKTGRQDVHVYNGIPYTSFMLYFQLIYIISDTGQDTCIKFPPQKGSRFLKVTIVLL